MRRYFIQNLIILEFQLVASLIEKSISAIWNMAYDFTFAAVIALSSTWIGTFSFPARKIRVTIGIICAWLLSSTFGKWMSAIAFLATTNGSMIGWCTIGIWGTNFIITWIFALTIFTCQMTCTLCIWWTSWTITSYRLSIMQRNKTHWSHILIFHKSMNWLTCGRSIQYEQGKN